MAVTVALAVVGAGAEAVAVAGEEIAVVAVVVVVMVVELGWWSLPKTPCGDLRCSKSIPYSNRHSAQNAIVGLAGLMRYCWVAHDSFSHQRPTSKRDNTMNRNR